jgi:hypothetical protein
MHDPIMEEIWRVREELIKKHGGFENYFKYIQKLDRARLRREAQKRKKAAERRRAAAHGKKAGAR